MYEVFSTVINNKDLWNIIKRFMYPNKRSSTFNDYKDGVAAIFNGYTHLINNKVLNYNYIPQDIGIRAISFGDLELIKAIRSKSPIRFDNDDVTIAAGSGFLSIVKYFHKDLKICPSKGAINASALNGHLEVVRYLINNTNIGYSADILDDLAIKGYLEILKLLFSRKKMRCTHRGLAYSVKNNDLEMVKFIVLNMGVKYSEYTISLSTNQEITTFLQDNL